MQTFLPHPSFPRSAAVLDDRRLGKQRVETLQILRALHLDGYGWANHPAVLMWRGHARALVAYGLAMVQEWCARGFRDTTRPNIAEFASPRPALPADRLPADETPPWLGRAEVHRSHQAALVRKNPSFYRPHFPDVDPDLPYVWPEPPTGRSAVEPFTAWVFRPLSDEVRDVFLASGFAGVPAAFGSPEAPPKQHRQEARLRSARLGDRTALVDGDSLVCGRLTGDCASRRVAAVDHLARDVAWERAVRRADLRRPYQLQDPQRLFALRGEKEVVGAPRRSG